MTIEEVFRNVPVRRKQMSSPKAKALELKKVQALLHALSIACPSEYRGLSIFPGRLCSIRGIVVAQGAVLFHNHLCCSLCICSVPKSLPGEQTEFQADYGTTTE